MATVDYLASLEQSIHIKSCYRVVFIGFMAMKMVRKTVFLRPTPRTAIIQLLKVQKSQKIRKKLVDQKFFDEF